MLSFKDWYPIAMFFDVVVLLSNASNPIATLLSPVVLLSKALAPTATFCAPVVLDVRALWPTAVLFVPVVRESNAVLPTFMLLSVNPIPNLPAVIATPTFIFCRNVAFVFVLMFSVPATPVNPVPSP